MADVVPGEERGYSVVELLGVMVILGVVLSGLTAVFVSGSNASVDLNRRFAAAGASRARPDSRRHPLREGGAGVDDQLVRRSQAGRRQLLLKGAFIRVAPHAAAR